MDSSCSKNVDGLYTQRNKIHSTHEVGIEGSTCLLEEKNGFQGPNLDAAAAGHDGGDKYLNTEG